MFQSLPKHLGVSNLIRILINKYIYKYVYIFFQFLQYINLAALLLVQSNLQMLHVKLLFLI